MKLLTSCTFHANTFICHTLKYDLMPYEIKFELKYFSTALVMYEGRFSRVETQDAQARLSQSCPWWKVLRLRTKFQVM